MLQAHRDYDLARIAATAWLLLDTHGVASRRRRAGAVFAARSALAAHAADADLMLIHDPELLLALPSRRRPPVIRDMNGRVEASAARSVPGSWRMGPWRTTSC